MTRSLLDVTTDTLLCLLHHTVFIVKDETSFPLYQLITCPTPDSLITINHQVVTSYSLSSAFLSHHKRFIVLTLRACSTATCSARLVTAIKRARAASSSALAPCGSGSRSPSSVRSKHQHLRQLSTLSTQSKTSIHPSIHPTKLLKPSQPFRTRYICKITHATHLQPSPATTSHAPHSRPAAPPTAKYDA